MVESSADEGPRKTVGDAVALPAAVLALYDRFSVYNSPYPAHDRGCAIDLYPDSNDGTSPVAGEVLDTRTVRCPPKPYAGPHDHLILVDVADGWAGGAGADLVARILHVEPSVEPGDTVAVGDSLGEMVRSGFFGQWVDNHVHLGFRRIGENAYRASGSLPVVPGVDVTGLDWDGTGSVVEAGETFARLDSPVGGGGAGEGANAGGTWRAIAAADGTPLDGGLVHYAGGGVLAPATGPVSLLGARVGVADGRNVDWADVAVFANGERATGLSLFAGRGDFGAKLVFHEGHDFAVGDAVDVEIRETAEPIRLG